MSVSGPASDVLQSSAQLILDVAKAASAHLDLSDVLEALIRGLRPHIRFDAIGVVVLEGEFVRLHSLYIEALGRRPGESIESILSRFATKLKIAEPPRKGRMPLSGHHLSILLQSHQPYVCTDIDSPGRFIGDEALARHGVRSYIALPLLKHGKVIGA